MYVCIRVNRLIINWFSLQKDMFDVVDELLGPLNTHIASLLSQPVTGTDDGVTHVETRRSYLGLVTNVLSSGLQRVFISERALNSQGHWRCVLISTYR